MGEDISDQDRQRDQGLAALAYSRTTPVGAKISVAALFTLSGLLITVLGLLLGAWATNLNNLNSNFVKYADANNAQHQDIWKHVQRIESWICSRNRAWKGCD